MTAKRRRTPEAMSDRDPQRRRNIRTALLLLAVAVGVYATFIYLAGSRGGL